MQMNTETFQPPPPPSYNKNKNSLILIYFSEVLLNCLELMVVYQQYFL